MGAKSANQILPLKFCGGTEVLQYIHLTTLSSWRVEGESGSMAKQYWALVTQTCPTVFYIYTKY